MVNHVERTIVGLVSPSVLSDTARAIYNAFFENRDASEVVEYLRPVIYQKDLLPYYTLSDTRITRTPVRHLPCVDGIVDVGSIHAELCNIDMSVLYDELGNRPDLRALVDIVVNTVEPVVRVGAAIILLSAAIDGVSNVVKN